MHQVDLADEICHQKGGHPAGKCILFRLVGWNRVVQTANLTHTFVQGETDYVLIWNRVAQKANLTHTSVQGETDYVLISDNVSGEKRVEAGPQLLFLGAFDVVVRKDKAFQLDATQYVRLIDERTGKIRVEKGEAGIVIPGAYEKTLHNEGVLEAIDLKSFEYVRVQNKKDGTVRIAKGEQLLFLDAYEEPVPGSGTRGAASIKQVAQEIDSETAVLVRNKRTGQQRLVTDPQVFFPTAEEEIIKVEKLIKLADYEGCAVRGKDGADRFYFGSNPEQRSFFLPPHSEVVELLWSRGRRRERRDLKLWKIDLRPYYMSFEFNTHTKDNVELILEGSFFWQITDLASMVRNTGDTTGDVCNHARSKFIEAVSKVTLQEFMSEFNRIAEDVHKHDDTFYSERGVKIHSLEVTSYRCADDSTAKILQQIIQETTNRMNRLQQKESENEVALQHIKGEIEHELARGELIQAQVANTNATAKMEGLAEGERLSSFLAAVSDRVPDPAMQLDLWKVLRKTDALQAVAGKKSHFFYTPNDANLTIETLTSD